LESLLNKLSNWNPTLKLYQPVPISFLQKIEQCLFDTHR
jgi:hypothetical protein